ncbi:MAG: FAD-dependent oxidoreductase [Defluviitaleaceae bacterium]|nr:FAD-dependent oxidoreductase [Defluviitaleaceae bacterium]MCL2239172.1 FAD-dependent oxidoreductase [Defluviitaleaceae bacterium]
MAMYDVIVIGAGAAGLSTAIYAGRAKLKTLVLEKSGVGGQIKITAEVVNYPGVLSTSGAELAETMKKQALRFGVTFTTGAVSFATGAVRRVDFAGDVKTVEMENGEIYTAVSVVIATGAKPRKLGFEGEAAFAGRGIAYCATCDGAFFAGKDIFVIGAGFAAAEEALFLTRFARKVIIIAREPAFTCSQTIADKVLAHEKIEVKFNTEIVYVRGERVVKSAGFVNNQTQESWEHSVDEGTFGVFIFVGYEPESEAFKGQVAMDKWGYIPTDEDMQTDIPGVYAAGDIRPKRLRQLVTATADGAIAATAAEKYIADTKARAGIVVAYEPEPSSAGEPLLDAQVVAQIKHVMARCAETVHICAVLQPDCGLSAEMRKFLAEFAAATERMPVRLYEKGENPALEAQLATSLYPVIALLDKDEAFTGVSFHGVPGGHELESFILAIYNAAGPGQAMEDALAQRIKNLPAHTLKIGVSLSCTMCPELVQACQRIALRNGGIAAAMVDLQYFPALREQYDIMSVPAVIIDDRDVLFGKKGLEELVNILG